MIPTVIGGLILILGAATLFQPPIFVIAFVCFCTLIPAASAVDLPMLGGSTIPPGMLALVFVALRLLGRDMRESPGLGLGLLKNAWLLIFAIYCAATAFVLPRIFAGRIDLIPMGRAIVGYQPLQVSAQNTTQALYMLGTAFTAVAAAAFATRMGSAATLIKALVIVAWIHVFTGLVDLVAGAFHIKGVFDLVRTGGYAQLTQDQAGFRRISGMTPEPSTYAALGGGYFVLMCELWLRAVLPRRTGPAALATAAVLVVSTSSTAYGLLAIYALVIMLRTMLVPGSLPLRRAATLVGVSIVAGMGALFFTLANPRLMDAMVSVLTEGTLRKAQSISGIERGLWNKQGWDAMIETRGLGVGVGSFRSSNLFTAILGAVGPAGLLLFIGYCLQIAKLGRRATYMADVPLRDAAGAACGWTALLCLAPAALTWPSADPGLFFALMAGLSLGWRSGVVARPTRREARAGLLETGQVAAPAAA